MRNFVESEKQGITDGIIEVSVDDAGILQVRDRRTGVLWESMPLLEDQSISDRNAEGGCLSFTLRDGSSVYSVQCVLCGGGEFSLTVSGSDSMTMRNGELRFPRAFRMPGDEYSILMTDGEGLLLPVTDTDYPMGTSMTYFCGGGICMSWIGAVDGQLESGYMITLETPYDAGIEMSRDSGRITFSPVWYSSMGTLSYERTVRFSFFEQGGYVAQCRNYRDYIWKKNDVLSLREKEKRFPALNKMLGGVHVYLWNDARRAEFIRGMKEAGVERAMFLWDPNHRPYPEPGFDEQLKEMGYATGAYDLYTDFRAGDKGDMPLSTSEYPKERFAELTAVTSDGGAYGNRYGNYICPAAIRDEIRSRMNLRYSRYSPECFFLDVYCANGVYECWHKDHPLTREGYMRAMMENAKLVEDEYGAFVGGEFGADYGAASHAFFHGMMTIQRIWFDSEITQKGTVYYGGDWKNNESPSVQVGTHTAAPSYYKYCINEKLRVPLYELVYHDAAVTSWRWEDGNCSCPEIWWKKDLFNMLYGTAPLWSIDAARWNAFSNDFAASFRKISPWLQEICRDALVSHRFLNADRTLQESVFSSGRRIVVNFGDEASVYEGRTIDPRGYILL